MVAVAGVPVENGEAKSNIEVPIETLPVVAPVVDGATPYVSTPGSEVKRAEPGLMKRATLVVDIWQGKALLP